MKRIRTLAQVLMVVGLFGLLSLGAVPNVNAITVNDQICNPTDRNGNPQPKPNPTPQFCKDVDQTKNPIVGPSGVLTKVIQLLVFVTGLVSVVIIAIGGLRYTLSGGDSNATKGAKDTILYALVGLVVAIFAQGIVAFVLNKL